MEKKRYQLKKQSRSGAKAKAEYVQACKQQDEEMIDEHDHLFCVSCHFPGTSVPLGHAHNLPVGQFPKLRSDPENFKLRCQDFGNHHGCHNALDSHDFDRIKNFYDLDQIMEYRKEHDRNAYNTFVSGLKSVKCQDYEYLD